MNGKKVFMYFVSFLSLSLMFSASYYFSYKHALRDFNRNAVERNNELILSLENRGYVLTKNKENDKSDSNSNGEENTNTEQDVEGAAVDTLDELIVKPSTKYTLETYNMVTGEMVEEQLATPSYLVGLNREEVIKYLHNYMEDLPWNEFQQGLTAFELLLFSEDAIVIRKTYNPGLVEYEFFLKSQDGNIVVFYSDQKTVYEFTGMSVDNLTQYEQLQLEEGFFVKDLDELYSILEGYSS